MPGLVYKSDDPDEQIEERREAVTYAIQAMVAAHHVQIMDTCGMARDTFEPQFVEVLDPDYTIMRSRGGTKPKPSTQRSSVLRGGVRRAGSR